MPKKRLGSIKFTLSITDALHLDRMKTSSTGFYCQNAEILAGIGTDAGPVSFSWRCVFLLSRSRLVLNSNSLSVVSTALRLFGSA